MRVLIIGCGYVGSALAAELAGRGAKVYGLRRSDADTAQLAAAGVVPVRGDITRPEELAKLPGPFDWVVFTASSGRAGLEEYRRVYSAGTRNILKWLQAASPRKYVYTSSTGVYAQNDGSWVDENSATEPSIPTSRVLLETEKLLLDAWAADRFPAVILRVAGIYGPGRGYPFVQFLKNVARLEADGARFMNMIHRDDVAGAIVAALERGRPGEIYNAVDDEPVTQRAFYEWLSARLGKPMPPSAPLDEDAPRKRGLTNKRVSNRKLKAELGYHFKHPTFREGYAVEIASLQGGGPTR